MTTGSREPESGGVRTPPLFPFFLFFFPSLFSVEFGSTLSVLSPSMLHCFKRHVDFGGGGRGSCSAHSGRFSADSVCPLKEFISAGTFVISSSFCHFFSLNGGNHITAQHQGEEEKQKLQKAQARKRPQVWMWLRVDFNRCQTQPHRSDH